MQIKSKYDRKNRQRETHNFTFLRLGSWHTIVVNLRNSLWIKLIKKSSLRSYSRLQFSPHKFKKAPGFSF